MTFLKTGFNGAAALQPRKAGRRRRPHAAGPAASMGPRLFSRGRGGLAVYKTSEWLASMGPRLFSRGRVTNTPTALSAGALQWGRGSSAAEGQGQQGTDTLPGGASMGPRLFSRGRYGVLPATVQFWELQWGRGSSAAEGLATAPPIFQGSQLQWGRGSSAAEGEIPAALVREEPDASMGPRLFSRGRERMRFRQPFCRFRFNGAAALQPRKVQCGAWPARVGVPASMGPRLFSRGREVGRCWF